MRATPVVLITLCLVLASCHRHGVRGSGTPKSEQRTLGEFSIVEVSGTFKVTIQRGEISQATVSTDDNLVPLVKTEVRDSRLLVYTDQDVDPRTELLVDIMTPSVSSVSASGVASVEIRKVRGEQLTLVLSGTGSMEADGSVGDASLVISGAGSMSARNLHAANTRITMSGAGKAEVFATDKLDVTISGAGSVNYYGDPKEVRKNISGVGFVTKK